MEASVAAPPEPVQITVDLTPQEAQTLRELSAARNLPEDVVLREALLEKQFFADNRRRGNSVVLEHSDGQLSRVNWTYSL